uniref:EGF-like domain-containing protein n=1 Tax=Branchiostoma floridae TaxID=7739 RepID=C3YEW5_BRAFL|eukprot:XP_002605199.1 hypothetical protein BRAFLDRAFT_80860 [Branchiostoma floridae]
MRVLEGLKMSCHKKALYLVLMATILLQIQVHGSRDTYYVHSTSEDTSGHCTCTVLAPSPDVCSDDAKYHYIKDLEAQVANLTTLVHQLANRTSSALDIQTTMTLIHNLTSQLDVLEADRQLLLTEYFSGIRDEVQTLVGLLPQLQADSADALLLQVYHTQLSNLSGVLSDLQEQHGLSTAELQLQVMQLTEQLNNCNTSKEDPCDKNQCDNHATCVKNDDSYTCTCNTGYTGDGFYCQDVDECAFLGRCPVNSDCINVIGSFSCQCHSGHSGPSCTATSTTITTTEETTTVMVATTAGQPTPHVGWGNGQSVQIHNIIYTDGVSGYINSGWKVDPTIDEEITDAVNHTGHQSWHYKSGTNAGNPSGPGDKTPFSPGLSVKVGRTDGAYTGDADSFYVSFWFKMAHDGSDRYGDGTRMLVVAGDPDGTDASSNYLEINFPYRFNAKVEIRTKESHPSYAECAQSKDCGDDFGLIYTTIANRLDPTTWHHVEMTLRSRPQDYMDEWFYVIDGDTANPSQGGAFYKTQQYDEGRYLYVNRVSFIDISSNNRKKGIYFDDINYKAYNSSNPALVLDEYSTSFEPIEN